MTVTIDYISKCQIDPAVCGNELVTLRYLSVGLHYLYSNVMFVEKPIRERDEKDGVRSMSFGNDPSLPKGAVDLLPCFFHWYGVSLMNYARLVGFLSGLSSGTLTRKHLDDKSRFDAVREYCDSYVDSIPELSAVKVWRDKVAAHFAITAPRKKQDNPTSLDFSVMYPVGYDNGRFRVGIMHLVRTDSAGNAHIGELPVWLLTEVHEALQRRYWKTVQ